MKKLLFFLVLAFPATFQTWAQTQTTAPAQPNNPSRTKGSFYLTAGGALPIGAFASKDVNDPTSGLAKLGGLAGLGYSHPMGDATWGLTIGIRGRINAIDGNANKSLFASNFPLYTSWSTTSSHWKTLAALAGIYYVLPAAPKLDVRLEASLGVAKAYLPDYTVMGVLDTAATGPTGLIQAKVNKSNATTFTASVKAGIQYHLNEHIQLLANLDFWYLKPNFKNLTQNIIVANGLVVPGYLSPSNATSITYYSDTHDYKQPMNSLNLSVGIGLTL